MDTGIEATIKQWARELGFSDCRIARAGATPHHADYHAWLELGYHGSMEWMARNVEKRSDPCELVPSAKSVISLALNYYPGESTMGRDTQGYRIARYAWNDDYHDLIWERLRLLDQRLSEMGGQQRTFTDSGPVLERDIANDAGLGWNGKSSMQIHRSLGTWFFLAEIITTLDLQVDPPQSSHCGQCDRCLRSCPTQAIIAPHVLDARKCISYLTIENKGSIPPEYRKAIGDRIYGCDQCLEVCPWNRFAKTTQEIRFHARREIFQTSLRGFLALDDEGFRKMFAGSPIKRIKRERFLRNVCVALGNVGTLEDLPLLAEHAASDSEMLAEHAQWAMDQIQQRQDGND